MSGNRTPAGRTAITTKISHLPGKFLTPPLRRALSHRAQLGPKRIAYGMPEKRNFSCRITPRRKEEGGNVEDLQTRPEKRVRARLNFRRRHKLPSTARKQIIFSAHRVCAAKGRRGETAAAYVASSFEDSSTSSSLRVPAFLLAHGGSPAAACSGGLEFPYSDPTEMRHGNSRRRIRDEKSVKTRYRESVQQMSGKRRFGDSRSRATGTSENAKKLPSLSPFLNSRDFKNPKRHRQLNIQRSEKNSLSKNTEIRQSNMYFRIQKLKNLQFQKNF
ncbi:hypothetical protein ALC56_02854 [Trachymyrmex septentrionalis]|uniref:Uncharacterized protein n=1 Tax=Trachymyrmex septentrionalis TaxID=34720 RepID=A0A151K0C7_9HYME|nr:hypothetical protein ALC56_02854 [Trachymyrmex septentrionalis]